MATPLGHALAGYAVYSFTRGTDGRDNRRLLLLCIFAATAPDLDFVPGLLMGTPARYHQGVTHSLGFALLMSLGAAGVGSRWGISLPLLCSCTSIASLSHLVLDFLGPDTRPPFGIPLLWPISDQHFISPVPILLGVRHATTAGTSISEWAQRLLHLHNFAAIAWEALLAMPFILLGRWYRGIPLSRQSPK
jgi:inner membrane protein